MKAPLAMLALLLTAAFVSPSAAAIPLAQLTVTFQGARIDVGPDHRLTPESEIGVAEFRFRVAIPQVIGGFGLGLCPLGHVIVEFDFKKPEYARVAMTPHTTIVELGPQQTSAEVGTTLFIITSAAAPAGEAGLYTVSARAYPTSSDPTCTYGASSPALADVLILNG